MKEYHVYNATYTIKGVEKNFDTTVTCIVNDYFNDLFFEMEFKKYDMLWYEILNLAYMEKNNSLFYLDETYLDNLEQAEIDNLFNYLNNEVSDEKIIKVLNKNGVTCKFLY